MGSLLDSGDSNHFRGDAPEDSNATRVGPSPDLGFPHRPQPQSDAETRVAAAPDLSALKPAMPLEDDETRVASTPDLGALKPAMRLPAMPLEDDETRVASTPDLGALRRPMPQEEDDATRVGPLPRSMPTQDGQTQVAPPPSEQPKVERRTIAPVDLPADLRLPSFDFKLSSSPDVAAAKAAGVHTALPEHLQLPTFPDLGKPPVSRSEVSVPPPVPKKAAPPKLPQLAEPSPPVLDLSLPELAPRPAQRNLTLISGSSKDGKTLAKRLMWPFVVAGVCAAIALGLFMEREQVMAVLAPKHAPPVAPPPTPQERAKSALAAGSMAYVAKDYQVAIHHFEEALKDDPRLVDAHRSLGIVYATLHDQAKAVRHYQDYLALSPHAPDATDVLKIIEDYKHAQAKTVHEAPPPPVEQPKHHKGARGQSGRRHKG